ncbi:MAG: transporter [Desulfobulbaceae bacterium BRH_c16a]|nr:MAG: transporter [Desulfobulbaceae bacterium BRH_c16a]
MISIFLPELAVIVLNSLFPIFILLLIGCILKRQGLTDSTFLKTADRLIYYFFFPVMLFWKIGGASLDQGIDWNFCFASLSALLSMFILSILVIKLFRISDFKAGSFGQSCYRFNTYIGVAVILNSLGTEGVKYFGIVIGFAIPLINLFAVSTLIWFSGKEVGIGKRARIVGKALVANPLILGCLAGIAYSRTFGVFPVFINNSLSLISMVALPMALISIGGSLSFAGVKGNLVPSFAAAALKLAVLPLFGLLFYSLFDVTGVPFKVGMIFLALPASTAIYVLSSQMNSDTHLASAAIVVSTVLSFVSLSVALLL